MKPFINSNFLLNNTTAQNLYHNYAAKMPIIDYHCHLSPKDIAENRKFETITELWLNGDHYKWRGMRAFGIDEYYITGQASDWEKFKKWAEFLPYAVRNPLYHWAQLELKRYFDIDELLTPETAEHIFNKCNALLKQEEYRTIGLLRKMNVEVVCTTDDPIDSLEYHAKISNNIKDLRVLPAWRPDNAFSIEKPKLFMSYLESLEDVSGVKIVSFKMLINALKKRHDFFHLQGCRISDHGIEFFYSEPYTDMEIEMVFSKVLDQKKLTDSEIRKYKSALLYECALMDYKKEWVQQYHYGVLRNNNSRLYNELGPDTGFDSIGQFNTAKEMQQFFNRLDFEGKLAKSIIYNINPVDNEMIATMIGNFNDGSIKGKMQFGSAWWFLDQKDGMEKQINALSTLGLISCFVGMLTDSRSFLSYPRHEYFRRILCNMFGQDMENGEIPHDLKHVGKIIQDICYYNAKSYFDF